MIKVSNINKKYTIVKKDKGLLGGFKSLFSHKTYIKEAVKNISFNVAKGEIVGYIGSNGAGKSTTIKMMTGILTPDSGEIIVNGIIPYKNRKENAYNIGVVFGQRSQLSWDIPVRESFSLLKHIYKIDKKEFDSNLDYLTNLLDLQELLPLPIRQLSLGQKMRCEIAAAFLHSPSVVYLDEPTIGLDVDVKDKIRKFIKQINQDKHTTILLTTHDMKDIEELCERIIIIDKGLLLYNGSISNLKKMVPEKTINFETKNDLDKLNLDYFPSVRAKKINNTLSITYNTNHFSSKSIIENILSQLDVEEINIEDPSIETIVQKIYRKEIVL